MINKRIQEKHIVKSRKQEKNCKAAEIEASESKRN